MPCICGGTCNCCIICQCLPNSCFCKTCIDLRNPQQSIIESPSQQINGQNKSQSRKRSAQSDRSNEQMSSLVSDSTPGKSQMIQSSASGFDPRRPTLGLGVSVAGVTPSPNVAIENPILKGMLAVRSPGPPKRPRVDTMESSTSEDDNPSTNEDDNPSTNEDDNPSTNEDDNQIF